MSSPARTHRPRIPFRKEAWRQLLRPSLLTLIALQSAFGEGRVPKVFVVPGGKTTTSLLDVDFARALASVATEQVNPFAAAFPPLARFPHGEEYSARAAELAFRLSRSPSVRQNLNRYVEGWADLRRTLHGPDVAVRNAQDFTIEAKTLLRPHLHGSDYTALLWNQTLATTGRELTYTTLSGEEILVGRLLGGDAMQYAGGKLCSCPSLIEWKGTRGNNRKIVAWNDLVERARIATTMRDHLYVATSMVKLNMFPRGNAGPGQLWLTVAGKHLKGVVPELYPGWDVDAMIIPWHRALQEPDIFLSNAGALFP